MTSKRQVLVTSWPSEALNLIVLYSINNVGAIYSIKKIIWNEYMSSLADTLQYSTDNFSLVN